MLTGRGCFQGCQLGLDRRFFSTSLFSQSARTALHLRKCLATGREEAPQLGKYPFVGVQVFDLLRLFSCKGASGTFQMTARLMQFLPDHIHPSSTLLHCLAGMGEAMLHSGENCGNPQRLHRMTQRRSAFFVKSLHHASGSGNGIVLGCGHHAADLMHFVFRLVHQEGTSGLDASFRRV